MTVTRRFYLSRCIQRLLSNIKPMQTLGCKSIWYSMKMEGCVSLHNHWKEGDESLNKIIATLDLPPVKTVIEALKHHDSNPNLTCTHSEDSLRAPFTNGGVFFYLSGMQSFEWRLSPPAWMIMWQVAMPPSPHHQLRQASGAFRSPRASLVHWLHPIILSPILPRMGAALCSRMTSCVVRRQLKNNLSSSDIFHSGRHRLCQARRFKEPDVQDLTSLITI